MRSLLVAVQFLTCIPVPIQGATAREIGRSATFFPLVGVLIGGVLYGAYLLLGLVFPDLVARLLTLLVLIAVSGSFHLDGLSDAVDGLYGGRTREDALRIMRDPHVGAMGVVAIVAALLLKAALFVSFSEAAFRGAILTMPVVGHAVMVAFLALPYAREEGLGRAFADHRWKGDVPLAGMLAAGVVFAVQQYAGLLALVGTCAAASVLLLLSWRKIGGVTGDVCGAANEVGETAFLLSLLALAPRAGFLPEPLWRWSP